MGCAMSYRSPHRDAIRLLFILLKGCEYFTDVHPMGAIAIFRGEAKLHACDFWMRNPDYLADELLDRVEIRGERKYLETVAGIFENNEPDIRRLQMIRYRFGAFEKLDEAMALLRSRDLVRITGSKSGLKVLETDFLLMPGAVTLGDSILKNFPVLAWYEERARLVAEIVEARGGTALKARQYEQVEYASTELGGVIPSITQRVRARFIALSSAA